MIQVVLEGIALRASEVLSAMNDFSPISPAISIDDDMADNPYFCQFLATVLERDVHAPQLGELTAFGTAMLAKSYRDKNSGIDFKNGDVARIILNIKNMTIETGLLKPLTVQRIGVSCNNPT